MPDQNHGGIVILIQMKAVKLLQSPLHMVYIQQLSQPTHLLPNSTSCIDLVFTNQLNLLADCGIHPSLHPNCHH